MARTHVHGHVRDSIQEREALLACFGVDLTNEMAIGCVPWVQHPRRLWISQASSMVLHVPRVQHVVELAERSRDSGSLTSLRVLGVLPERARVVHEDHVWNLSAQSTLLALHDVRNHASENQVNLHRAFAHLMFLPIQEQPAAADGSNDPPQSAAVPLLGIGVALNGFVDVTLAFVNGIFGKHMQIRRLRGLRSCPRSLLSFLASWACFPQTI